MAWADRRFCVGGGDDLLGDVFCLASGLVVDLAKKSGAGRGGGSGDELGVDRPLEAAGMHGRRPSRAKSKGIRVSENTCQMSKRGEH